MTTFLRLAGLSFIAAGSFLAAFCSSGARAKGERAGLICAGGPTSDLEVSVEPDRIDSVGGRDEIRFRLEMRHHSSKSGRARYAVELLNQDGQLVGPARISDIFTHDGHESVMRSTYATPPGLADGTYELRVTAAAAEEQGSGATYVHSAHFRIAAGQAAGISQQEWLSGSKVNQATLGKSAVASPQATCRTCDPGDGDGGGGSTGGGGTGGGGAPANTGTVTGTIQYYNNQGNFCPTTRDCSGTYYPQSEFHAYVPVRDTRVYIRRDSDSAIIGQGSTNAGGQFTISWSIPGGTGDVQANLIWVGEHKDGRFAIRASDGSQYIFWTMPFTLHSHGTDSVGALSWGTENSPNPIANVYDGAWRTWRQFSLSNRLVTYFTGVEIRYPSSDCPTSCTSGSDKLVKLDPDSAYAPQARVMHELGHVASYVSNRDQSRSLSNDYCYPNTGGNCGWSLQTAEWSQDAFEEGFATFAGDTALASPWSTAPHTCYQSAAACSTGHHNEESSPGATGQCASDENRFPLSVVRYLWDAYDFNVDYPTETLARDPHEFFDTLNSFDNGRDNHQKDEPQCCILGYCYLCTRDGRSAVDFKWNWANWGTDSSSAWTNNCSPTGD